MTHKAIALRVKGKVQGVGFRPFVWQLAHQLELHGEVSNDAQGVLIVLQLPADIPRFSELLRKQAPPLARIDSISEFPWSGTALFPNFRIIESKEGVIDTHIVPDAATCSECLREMNDPADRRYEYPFINCTHCGPRFTIIHRLPYDRPFTTMANFPLCPDCEREYHHPGNRRFHAQPIACAHCGPQLWYEDHEGELIFSLEAIWQKVIHALNQGKIAAIKGLGGFHFACDATNPQAIQRLRERKRRPMKPLAIMLPNTSWLSTYCRVKVTPDLLTLLSSNAAPIVLIPATPSLPWQIAPGRDEVGVMLPANPVHHLLMQKIGRPLVMTSGNAHGLPPALHNHQAKTELRAIADIWLLHNRDIMQRVDDSVIRWSPEGQVEMLRRSRGYVPDIFELPPSFAHLPCVAALGGDLKNTFCLLRGQHALLSQHLGDLSESRNQTQFCQTWKQLHQLYQFLPAGLACDLHPNYYSSKLAQQWAQTDQLTCLPVQHHHAHLAACMAEHAIPLDTAPLIGLALDGLGYGIDGALWGGECLRVDYRTVQYLGGLPPVALPGSDLAARQPWRNLLAQMLRFVPHWQQCPETYPLQTQPWQIVSQAIQQKINAPLASSTGRLFDAIAAALGISVAQISYEGEAASRLETLAWQAAPERSPVTLTVDDQGQLNMALFWQQWLAWRVAPARRARAFHQALAQGMAALVRFHSHDTSSKTIVISGGAVHNRLLRQLLREYLPDFYLLFPQQLPAGDGALSLGQAIIAAVQLQDMKTPMTA